jgi:alpha,alpha-trehalose phosphorylase
MVLQLYIDDEPLFVPSARIRQYERTLDMRNGLLIRTVLWSTPGGKHVRVVSCRLASLEYRHLAAISYEVTVLDHPAPVAICSQLINRHDLRPADHHLPVADPQLSRALSGRIFTCRYREIHELRMTAGYETSASRMRLAVGVQHVLDSAAAWTSETSQTDDFGQTTFTIDAEAGVPIRLTEYVSYHISRSSPATEPSERCVRTRTRTRAAAAGFESLRATQWQQLDNFWDRADVQVESARPGRGAPAAVDPVEPVPSRTSFLGCRGLRHSGQGAHRNRL